MAVVWGVLGQVKPASATLSVAYAVPATKHCTIQVIITNVGAAATVRVSHAVAGAADSLSQYLVYDLSVPAGTSISTAKFIANSGDMIRVFSSTGNVTFTVNGIEE